MHQHLHCRSNSAVVAVVAVAVAAAVVVAGGAYIAVVAESCADVEGMLDFLEMQYHMVHH